MNNSKGQPIKDGDILAESYAIDIEERIIVIEDRKDSKLYWRRLMGDVAFKSPINTLETEKYITIDNIYAS